MSKIAPPFPHLNEIADGHAASTKSKIVSCQFLIFNWVQVLAYLKRTTLTTTKKNTGNHAPIKGEI